jgi:hypothetical protein
MIAAAHFVASDRRMLAALSGLGRWVFDPVAVPRALPQIVDDLFRPATPTVASMVLALALGWWIALVLSILIAPLRHGGTPYFWGTTIIESIWGVGFERFRWPRSAFDEID